MVNFGDEVKREKMLLKSRKTSDTISRENYSYKRWNKRIVKMRPNKIENEFQNREIEILRDSK